jgi:VWFA-related protein
MGRLLSTLCWLGLLLSAASAQTPPPAAPDDDATVNFRSFSRMVLVDVVVKDSKGHGLRGLKPEDFELLEDNVPHRIASFSESTEQFSRKTSVAVHPQFTDIYTNARPREETEVRPSIVLLDLLNTPTRDRVMARRALLQFVQKRMQRNEPLAIFVLWNRLELLVDFTGDVRLIQAPLKSDLRAFVDPKKDNMGSDMMIRVADLFANPNETLAMLAIDPSRISDMVYKQLAESTLRIEDQFEAERAMNRVERTLAALRTIARFAEKQRGRKSLVWMSAAFPFSIQTEFGLVDFDDQIRQTSNQLSTAQVAVYPVDVRGLGPVEAKPFEEDLSRAWLSEPQDIVPQKFQEAYHQLFDSQNTMKEIADLTGGVAYNKSN